MPELDDTLRCINSQIREIEGRCAERGAVLARHEEHMRAVNGSLGRIDEQLSLMNGKLDEAQDSLATAKGVWIVASMVVGAVIAYASQYILPQLP